MALKTKNNIRILMVIAPKNFQEQEFFKPKNIFEENRVNVDVASMSFQSAISSNGTIFQPNLKISEIKIQNYDCILLVGGSGVKDYLWDNQELKKIVQEANKLNKIVAAICAAPVILARAGLLKGIKATAYPNKEIIAELMANGADYLNTEVVVSGNIVTAKWPKSAVEFAQKILGLLKNKN